MSVDKHLLPDTEETNTPQWTLEPSVAFSFLMFICLIIALGG